MCYKSLKNEFYVKFFFGMIYTLYTFGQEKCDKKLNKWEKIEKFQHKTAFPPKIEKVCLWVCRTHFFSKNIWLMKKFNKSFVWAPSISNMVLLFFFRKIWPSKVWKCNETKNLDFYQLLRFCVLKTFLKSYGSFFNVYWGRIGYSNFIKKN